MAFVDATVVNVALPAIRRDLHGGLAMQQWVMEAYLLTLGSLILIGGSLSDLFGRRRVFVLGVLSFAATSGLCALAPTSELLVAARALQGAAGALLIPSTLAVIVATFDEDERGAAIGTWTAWSGVAGLTGPLLGGVIVQVSSWRLVFAVSLLPAVVALHLIRTCVPEHLDRSLKRHVDVLGAVLCAVGLGGVVLALIEEPGRGIGAARVWAPLAVGVACLAGFLAHERRSRDPMLPLRLFRRRNFAAGNLTTLMVYAALGAATFLLPLHLQQVAGYDPVSAGLSLVPITAAIFLLSRRFGGLADSHGPRLFMTLGPLVACCGLLLLLRVGRDAPYATTILPAAAVFGVGMALTVAPLTAAVLAGVEEVHAGIASGVNNAVARVAGLLAIGAVGAVVASQFASALDAHGAAAARARPLAVESAPPRERAAVADASVEAFRAGIATCAGLMLIGGLVSAIGVENPRRRVEAAECPGGAILGASPDAGHLAAEEPVHA